MIQPERTDNMKFSHSDKVLNENRLILRITILVESRSDDRLRTKRKWRKRKVKQNRIGFRAARSIKVSWTEVSHHISAAYALKGVALERRVAEVKHAAKGQDAAVKHGVIPPIFAKTHIHSAVIELLVSKYSV